MICCLFLIPLAAQAQISPQSLDTLAAEVQPQVVVDPSLVGGVVAKVGDTVFDGSVASRLQELREAWG